MLELVVPVVLAPAALTIMLGSESVFLEFGEEVAVIFDFPHQ